jgi:hypothetical protein
MCACSIVISGGAGSSRIKLTIFQTLRAFNDVAADGADTSEILETTRQETQQ